MALKISLKPNEKIVVNGAVIANGDRPAQLRFLNNARFLREKDILTEENVHTDPDRIYFSIQLIYIDPPHAAGYQLHLQQAAELLKAEQPEKADVVDSILAFVKEEKFYEAMKSCRTAFPDILNKRDLAKAKTDNG